MSYLDILDEYQGLLIIQYKTKTKANATIKLLVNQSLCDGLPLDLMRAFDLDTASGDQLDILGRIVGVPRQVYGLDLIHTFFELTDYEEETSTVGFGRYNDNPYSTDLFLRYNNDATYSMSDFEMREVIRMKIIQNNTWSTLKDLMESLYAAFGTEIRLTDNKNMSIEYDSSLAFKNVVLVCEFLGILPRPMGVTTTVEISSYSSSSCSSSSSCRSSSSSSSSN